MNKPTEKTVLLGMSGGVDSTAAAVLLSRQGYQVTGAYLRLHDQGEWGEGREPQDLLDARAMAERLGIRLLLLDWRERFRETVLRRFVEDYDRGRTPNPCVTCNRYIKIPSLLAEADKEGIAYVATGHYAAVLYDDEMQRWRLHQADCLPKDQSYVLHSLTQQQLSRTLLPLAPYSKAEVRAIAQEAGLAVSQKQDSQDICFVPDGNYAAFLQQYTGRTSQKGSFVDSRGNVLGEHRGVWHYTIGQRKGLGISLGYPAFVREIHAESGKIVLDSNARLFSSRLVAGDLRWIDFNELAAPMELSVKIRYTHKPEPAKVVPLPDGSAEVIFASSQRAITPGQAAVFYRDGFVVGGGTIEECS